MLDKGMFITELSKRGYTKKDAGVIIDDFLDTLMEALVSGESVRFHGFGTFEVRPRKGRKIVPVSGGPEMIGADSKVVKFTAGNVLYRAVNED